LLIRIPGREFSMVELFYDYRQKIMITTCLLDGNKYRSTFE